MPLFRGNVTRSPTEPLTDQDGVAITTGDVRAAVVSEHDRTTVLIPEGAAVHIGTGAPPADPPDGTWRRDWTVAELATIPAGTDHAVVRYRVVVASVQVAEFFRVEQVVERDSPVA